MKMSRSYRKNPVIKDRYGTKALQFFKRQANKKIRNSDNVSQHNHYKKNYEQWKIHDYKCRITYDDLLKMWNNPDSWLHIKFKTLKAAIGWWKKAYSK